MASGTGMAGLVVTALVSALVAFGVASLLPAASAPAPVPTQEPPPGEGTADLRREVERLRREVEELRAAKPAPIRFVRGQAPGDPGGTDPGKEKDGEHEASPDPGAPLPSTRADLAKLIDERIDARAAAGVGTGQAPKRKTIDEAGAELGLSSVDIDSVKRVWQQSEMEALAMVMGTADMDAIKEEIKAAEDDPDKKAVLINKVVGNMFRNLGKMATIEGRRTRELKKFLSEDQVRKLKAMNIAPVTDGASLEGLMKGTFGN